jgi:hypothetical protein
MQLASIPHSHKAVWLIAIISLALFFVFGRWHRHKVIDSDVVSYYSYLPAVVIHGDPTMAYSLGDNYYSDKVWGTIWKDGMGPVQKYTMGMSLLYAPFFMLAHGSAHALGYPPDGYSAPYRFWLQLSPLFYLILGVSWLRKVLRQYFSEGITAVTLLVLAFGTNLHYYSHGQGPMPHVYLFALVSGLLLLCQRFHAAPTWGKGILIGLTCSLLTLVRPMHIVFWLVPVLYGITSTATLREKWAFWKQHFPKLLLWPVIQFLVVLPQLFYWRLLTDHWVYYSYRDEHFFWADPVVFKVFFSFRNGWLIYTPIMALGLAGLFLLRRHARAFSWILPLVFIASTYVIACWWCWWYGGSFGQRVFIDFYPILGLGLAAVFTRIHAWLKTKALRILAWAALGFFVALNLLQSFQYGRGIIHYDSMTAEAYLHAFLPDPPGTDMNQFLETPDYDAAKRGDR